jgi:hypothetical protein
MQAWGPGRTIRAEVVRELILDPQLRVTAKGVQIRGAKIEGCLDLENEADLCPLRLDCCCLSESGGLVLDRARIPMLVVTRSCLSVNIQLPAGLAVR